MLKTIRYLLWLGAIAVVIWNRTAKTSDERETALFLVIVLAAASVTLWIVARFRRSAFERAHPLTAEDLGMNDPRRQ